MAPPLILDISSTISEEKSLSSVLSVALIIQKSNGLRGVVPVVANIEGVDVSKITNELNEKGVRFIEIQSSLSAYMESIPKDSHILSDDPLVISRLGEEHQYWDHEDITQYTAKSLSDSVGFPHSAMTVYSMLCGASYYNLSRLDGIMSEEAIRTCRRFPTAKSLLEANLDDIPVSVANNIEAIKQRTASLKRFLNKDETEIAWDSVVMDISPRSAENSQTGNQTTIREVHQLGELYNIMEDAEVISISYENNVLTIVNGEKHVSCQISDKLSQHNVFNIVHEQLMPSDVDIYAFSSKTLRKAFMSEGLSVPKIDDLATLAYISNNLNKEPELSELIERELGEAADFEMDVQVSIDELRKLPQLFDVLSKTITPTQRRYYDEIEIPFLNVVSEMEKTGMKLDAKRLNAAHQKCLNMLEHCNSFVSDTLGEDFDLGDRKVIESLLYDKLNLKLPNTSKRSTDAETIAYIAKNNPDYKPVINAVSLAIRQKTMMNSYTNKYSGYINPETGHIHGTIRTTATKTGRISCSDPNLMGIPKKSNEGKLIKSCFVAPDGMAIVRADYSQIELKILAHMSKEPVLVEGFRKGLDVHRATAASVFEKPYEDITAEERQAAKSVNFGLIYGMQAKSLALEINKTESEAEGFMNKYFEKLPRVKQFLDWIKGNARANGYIKTLFQRHINIENIQSNNRFQVMAGERQASNAPMQASAADIIKKAMVDLYRRKESEGLGFNFVMQVHDEIILYSPLEEVEKTSLALKQAMENSVTLHVPINVDVEVSYNLASSNLEEERDVDYGVAI